MPGVGDVLAHRLIDEIEDIKKFRNKKSLMLMQGLILHRLDLVSLLQTNVGFLREVLHY